MALTRLNVNVEAHKSSSPEIYGFHKNSSGQLIVTTSNAGADNISHSTFTSFSDYFKGPSGIVYSISNGQLIATI
jgi:hypothetical protein|tara:strand:+ start:148 stop:372 length:225 start_codon:yes stop_codon:yes gene_type:complete